MAGFPALKTRNKLPRSIQLMVDSGRLSEEDARSAFGEKKRSKYGNELCELDGYKFDSKAEMKRYAGFLKPRLLAGEIRGLFIHPSYPIYINGIHVCDVELDFSYEVVATDEHIAEDVKGHDNQLSRLKRKLLEASYLSVKVQVIAC